MRDLFQNGIISKCPKDMFFKSPSIIKISGWPEQKQLVSLSNIFELLSNPSPFFTEHKKTIYLSPFIREISLEINGGLTSFEVVLNTYVT